MKAKLALPILAVGAVYVLDVGGAQQPMADAYISAVTAVTKPITDQYRENVEKTVQETSDKSQPAPAASQPVPTASAAP